MIDIFSQKVVAKLVSILANLRAKLQVANGDDGASVSDLDAVRGHLDHGGRHTVRAHCHVVHRRPRDEFQIGESPPCFVANICEGANVVSGVVESAISADRHLVVFDLLMLSDGRVDAVHFCNMRYRTLCY